MIEDPRMEAINRRNAMDDDEPEETVEAMTFGNDYTDSEGADLSGWMRVDRSTGDTCVLAIGLTRESVQPADPADTGERVSMETLHALADVLGAAISTKRVTWASQGDPDYPIEGVARAITTDEGHLFRGDNVLDGYLHVSAMMEHFLPMRDVVAWHAKHLFVVGS